jgi:LytS/YehU family sensor histidine kinase
VVCLYVLFCIASPWFGYRKWNKSPAWKLFLMLVSLALLGGFVGYGVGSFTAGVGWTELQLQKVAKAVAIAILVSVAIGSVLVGISRLRLREAEHRAGRLQAEADRERLARQTVQAELKLLQAQVEPHFLFNTLANLRYLVQSGSDQALPMLDHLIHYLRNALPDIRAADSTLGREAELARAYLEIMRVRMGGELQFAIDVPPALGTLAFPPLMLLTLVENAIKHGIAPVGRGRVEVRARDDGPAVVITVSDDGRGIGGSIGQGVGLANVRDRLRALHGGGARLELAGAEGGGAVATLVMPAVASGVAAGVSR